MYVLIGGVVWCNVTNVKNHYLFCKSCSVLSLYLHSTRLMHPTWIISVAEFLLSPENVSHQQMFLKDFKLMRAEQNEK